MTAEARSVVVRLSAETAQYIAQMQAAGRISANAMRPAEAAVMRQSAAIDDLGGKAGKLGLLAGAGVAAMAKAAIDWESQWAGVTKTVDGTAAQLNALEDDIRGLARTMPATHQEIAATAEAAGQLGVATEDITDFTEVMVMMGETTNLTADAAATSIAQFMNVLQSSAGDVDEIGNTIVDLGNKGASTEAQITDMAQRVAGAGATIGATEADVLGLSAAMANLGIQSELGGGAVQRVLLGINTQVASGGAKLESYADVAGTSAQEFARSWATDPVRAFDMLVQGLGRIQDEGGDVASVLESMGIKGTQNLQVMLRLAGSGDMLSRSLDQANAAWDENTALTDEYGKRAETTASQVQVAWNQIKDAAIEGGAATLPVVADIASGVGTIATAYGDLPGPIKDITTAGLALTAVLGGGLWFGAKVINGITSTKASLAALRPEITRVGTDLATRSGIRPFIADLGIMAATSRTAGATTERELARVEAASRRVRSSLFSAGVKGGGLLAGLTIASTDLADGMGLANTASYALMGSIAGPWGAAIGGGIGLVKDFAAASEDADHALRNMAEALDAGDIGGFTRGLAEANEQLAQQTDTAIWGSDRLGDSISGVVNALAPLSNSSKFFGALSGSTEDLITGIDKAESDLADLEAAATALGQVLGEVGPGAVPSLEQMSAILERAKPAMDDLGISAEDLMSAVRDGSIVDLTGDIADWLEHADSASGRAEALAGAIDALGNDMETTADRATALGDALDELLGPQMGLSEATDAWTTALRHLSDDLDKNNRTLEGNSDAAIKNRAAVRARVDAFKDLLVAEANAGAGSGKLSRILRNQREALIDAGKAANISKDEMRAYLKILGLTPDIVKTLIEADTHQALSAMDQVKRMLDALDGKRAQTVVETVYLQTNKPKALPGNPDGAAADGGTVPKTGLPYADRHLYLLADGEEIISNRHGQADRFRADRAAGLIPAYGDGGTIGAIGRLADGGSTGGRRRSIDERLEIVGFLQQIRDLRHDLAATVKKGEHKGEHVLRGLDRRRALLELEAAERDLRRAKHAEEREAKQEAREKAREQRQERQELKGSIGSLFDGIFPEQEQTKLQQVAAAIDDFKEQWLEAGGTWTKDMREWAKEAREAARQYDLTTAAIEAESARRDQLSQTLADQQSQLDSLNSTMASFNDTVAGNFLSDPFNRTVTVAGTAGPATAALNAAKAELAAVQAAGDAARASRLMQQIALLQEQADAETAPRELSGVAALRETLTTDMQNAEAFAAALQTLASKGLDTTGQFGGLYADLAQKGDLVTAQELAALSAAEIDEYEKLFAAREDKAAAVGALATQEVYGAQHAQMLAAVDQTNQLISAVDATLTLLEATQAVLGEQVRAGAEAGADKLDPRLGAIKDSVDALPRQIAQIVRQNGGK